MEQKFHNNYYQGILQLRNPDDVLIDFVKKELKENKIFVCKQVKLKTGVDYFVSSNKFLVYLSKVLKERFEGKCLITRKLFSRNKQTSRNIYRLTLLFKLANYSKGDIVEFKGDIYKVIKIAEKVQVKATKNGKRVLFNFDDFNCKRVIS